MFHLTELPNHSYSYCGIPLTAFPLPPFSRFPLFFVLKVSNLSAVKADKSDTAIHNTLRKMEANSLWQTSGVTHLISHTHTPIYSHGFLACLEPSQQADHSTTVTTQWPNRKKGSERKGEDKVEVREDKKHQ